MILLLSIIGFYFLFKNQLLKAKLLLSFPFLLLLFFAHPFVANHLTLQLEKQHKIYQNDTPVGYIHILGNAHNKNPLIPKSSRLSDASTKRVLEAVMIYKKMDKKPKLIFTGYAGINNDISNAKMMADFANQLGVKNVDMIINGVPKDTKEEADFSKTIVKNKPFLLVTSATHMPRAIQLFKRIGLNAIPVPTDFKGKSNNIGFLSQPSIYNLQKSQNAMHEFLGIAWYYFNQ